MKRITFYSKPRSHSKNMLRLFKSNTLLLFALLINSVSFAQHTDDATVLTVLKYGSQDVAILLDSDNSLHYKSTPYSAGELSVDQEVQLSFSADPEQLPEIVATTLTATTHANLMTIPSGDGNPSNDLLFALPEEDNDILFFNSIDHLFDVYDLMDAYLEETSTADLSEDEKLDIIQDQYPGFESYRNKYFETFLPSTGTFLYDDIVNAYDREFVNYNVLQTFLNDDRMIGVGDKIYYYHGQDYILEFDKTDSESRIYFAGIAQRFYSEEDLDLGNDSKTLELIVRGNVIVISNIVTIHGGKALIFDPITGYGYQSVPDLGHYNTSFCGSMVKSIRMTIYEYENLNGNGTDFEQHPWWEAQATFVIDWGDGTIETIYNYDGSEVFHTYQTEGVFEAQTTLTFTDSFGGTQVLEDGSNSNYLAASPLTFESSLECTGADAQKSHAQNLGGWMLLGKVWVQDNLITKQVGSSSHAYKLVNGSYQKEKAKIHCKINGTFRNNDCDVVETKSGDKTRNNRKDISKTKSKLLKKFRRVGELDVNSYHYLDEGGTFISFNIFITC